MMQVVKWHGDCDREGGEEEVAEDVQCGGWIATGVELRRLW